MTLGKLKAHNYFGQEKKFQGCFKLLAAQHKQKSMGPSRLNKILTKQTFQLVDYKNPELGFG
jgi:hypothetical protein